MAETKKILLIGRSGRGKSALANVILNKNNNFEEVFKESSGSVSETKKIQFEEFVENNTSYLVIDTPGIGDTKMSDNEVLNIIAEAVYLVKDGLSQVLFVVGGRFDQSEMATYNLLRTIIFDENITNHTTIARTRFANFRSKKECQEDIKLMKEAAQQKKTELESQIADNEKKMQSMSSSSEQYQKLLAETKKLKKELKSTLSEIIESCQGRVIHMDNPPVGIRGINDDDSRSNIKKRNKSREKILKYLSESCWEDYNPEKLQKLSNEIADDYFQYLVKKEELEAELRKLRSDNANSNKKLLKTEESEKKSEDISLEGTENKTSSVGEKKELSEDNQIMDDSLVIGEKIARLENKKDKLRKEIEEKERVIRQKVLKHIFSNYGDISNELGGDIFMESIIGDHDWGKIRKEFSNKELVVKWLSKEFDYEQVKKWVTVLGSDFNPEYDVSFCTWLRDDKKLTVEKIRELSHVFDIEQLRQEYVNQLEKETDLLEKHNEQLGQEEENLEEVIDSNINLLIMAFEASADEEHAWTFDYTSIARKLQNSYKSYYERKQVFTKKMIDSSRLLFDKLYYWTLGSNWGGKEDNKYYVEIVYSNNSIGEGQYYTWEFVETFCAMNIAIIEDVFLGGDYRNNFSDFLHFEKLGEMLALWKEYEKKFADRRNKDRERANENLEKAQEWLERVYPKKERKYVTQLNIDNERIEGGLRLEGFINLQKLVIKNNWKLTDLDLADLSSDKVTEIVINNNDLTERDLSMFSRFVNCEVLSAGNTRQVNPGENYDKFLGTLEYLKNLSCLKYVWVANSNVDSGLEHLPSEVEELYCGSTGGDNLLTGGGDKLAEVLKDYKVSEACYDFQSWRQDNQGLIERVRNNSNVGSKVQIQFPFKDIPSEYWDRVEVNSGWDREYRVSRESETPLMINGGSSFLPHKKFRNSKVLDGFKKYAIDPDNTKFFDFRSTWPNNRAPFIKDIKIEDVFDTNSGVAGNVSRGKKFTDFLSKEKLFQTRGSSSVVSQEAFEFLQSIVESREIKATIKLTQEEFEEFKKKSQQLQTQIEIPFY